MNQDPAPASASGPRTWPDLREKLLRAPSTVRLPILALDHFLAGNGTVRAAALTYTTLLAIVPMLAFAFASLRGLGFADELFEILLRQLGPVFDPEIRDRLYSYVTRVNVKTLGTAGLAAFLFSVVLTLNTVEKSLNTIFEVRHQRQLIRKLTDYFSILFLTPLLLGITISATAVFQARDFLAPLGGYWILTGGAGLLLKMVPMLASIILFTMVLMIIPNTHVRLKSAALGGVVGGVLWYFLQWGYVSFQVGFSRYEAIFGALAQLPILMVWIYFAWCILIYSAELAALAGGRQIRLEGLNNRSGQTDPAEIALSMMAAIAGRAATREPPWTLENMAKRLDSSPQLLKTTVNSLKDKGLLAESGEGGGLLLTRNPTTISAMEIVDAAEETPSRHENPNNAGVNALLDDIRDKRRTALKGVTLENLQTGEAAVPQSSRAPKGVRIGEPPAAQRPPARQA